jgi:hypothetical protein
MTTEDLVVLAKQRRNAVQKSLSRFVNFWCITTKLHIQHFKHRAVILPLSEEGIALLYNFVVPNEVFEIIAVELRNHRIGELPTFLTSSRNEHNVGWSNQYQWKQTDML